MSKSCLTMILVVVTLVVASTAFAQFTIVPGGPDTLTVSAFGNAEAPADWVDVTLYMKGEGENLESAIMLAQDECDRAVAELIDAGVAEKAIKRSEPQISSPGGMPIPMPEGQGAKWSASIKLTVRVDKLDKATMYEDIANIVDAATSVAKADAKPNMGMMGMMTPAKLLTFGVNDTKALKGLAIKKALEEAQQTAAVAAEGAGKKLGPIMSLQSMDFGTEGIMAVMSMFSQPSQAGVAAMSMFISVTYKLE